jgi:succinate-semialdehyde dehydrogenase / glutarate-semialdehyde dehydrogenase
MTVHAKPLNRAALGLKDPSLLTGQAYVAGEWIDAPDGKTIPVTDPFDGSLIVNVPNLGPEIVRRAIDKAHEVQKDWAKRTAKERSQVLRRWYDLIIENADDLALILTAEQGKPLAEAKGEVVSNAAYIEWFAEEAKRVDGDIVPPARGDQRIMVLKQPVGVCAAITPWNFPNGMITRKAGPALAAGCTLVLKPAAQTPLSAFALAVLAERAGVPKGAFSVVTGEAQPIGLEFCHNPKVAKITFTGSTNVGRWLMKEASQGIKRLSLELGGNAPFIVFDDADLDAAVEGAMLSKFRNAGQTCVCANRIYVQDGVYDAFAARLADKVKGFKVGAGTEPGVVIGPLIDEPGMQKVEQHVADAVGKGAKVLLGGKRDQRGGLFFQPTVLANVTPDMLVSHEENFGPVAPLIRFKTEEEVIRLANDTEFGLSGYFYSRDIGRTFRVAEAMETGIVGANVGIISTEVAPFGGVKQSGLGREGSRHGLDEYMEVKYILLGGIT